MEIDLKSGVIKIDRVLSSLDKLVLKYTAILEKLGVDYVIISGYVTILFGRSRQTEDVDIFIEDMGYEKFLQLWNVLDKEGFESMTATEPADGFNNYLKSGLALRFAVKGTIEPNFEVKLPRTELNLYSLNNRIRVHTPFGSLWTSKIELQMAFKLYLGSEKDIEDAAHLWHIFKDQIDKEIFMGFARRLKVLDRIKELE